MPNRDGTGPLGKGPLTGRGFGRCGQNIQGNQGFGYGQGRGYRNNSYVAELERRIRELENKLKEKE
jgi:hypothetical protein